TGKAPTVDLTEAPASTRAEGRLEPTDADRPPAGKGVRRLKLLTGFALFLGVVVRFTTVSPLWLDEAQTVALANLPLGDIVEGLRHDGAPPLFYFLLHGWMRIFGDGDLAVRFLPGLFSVACLPLAWRVGKRVGGRTVATSFLVLLALSPFAVHYATEARMYSMAMLLVLAGGLALANLLERPSLALSAAVALITGALLLTHYYALYTVAAVGAVLAWYAWRGEERTEARRALVSMAAGSLLFLPWVPVLLYQAAHTGAPWSTTPDLGGLANPLTVPLGEGVAAVLVTGVALVGLRRAGTEAWTLAVALLAAGVAAWAGAQLEPSWADRYMTVFAGPVILLAGAGLAAAGRVGVVVLSAAVLLWCLDGAPETKSNAREVARHLRPGDLVIVTHPEQTPVLRHYAGPGLRWATSLGPTRDPRIFDWRDAVQRLRAAEPKLVVGGRRFVLIEPARTSRGGPEWIDLVTRRAAEWHTLAETDPRLKRIAAIPSPGPHRNSTDVRALVYQAGAPRP
ncbi:MAG: glycosyltransferase family 39 protein, partial [Actinomycetota bacterium]|nr:glycosyltransferase family 39 protein [Actinomycetota bacterium]